jgi:hypothetical protein
MPNSSGEPKSTQAQDEPLKSENLDQTDSEHIPQEMEPAAQESAADSEGAVQSKESEDWWRASPPVAEWAKPDNANFAPAAEVDPSKESATADVYFCGRTTLFPLNRALQAIAKEELTGALRAYWDQEPIELLAKEGTIAFVTARDPDLYCPEAPAVLANVDTEIVAQARAQQKET